MQLLGMGEDRPLLNQLLFLALEESGGSDLPSLMLKQVETLSLLPLPRHQGVQFHTKGLPPAVESAEGCHVTGQPGIGVEQEALAMRKSQEGALVLAMDLDQEFGEAAKRRRRRETAVQVCLALSLAQEVTPNHEELVSRTLDPAFRQQMASLLVIQIEGGLYPALLGPGAYLLRLTPCPQGQPQRVDDDRFAGAGFAREDIEPRAELNAQLVDQGKVRDAQFAEHGVTVRPT
jgi:hypothetical protein